ncbi:MAG: hypothetical protein QXP77_00680 [Candidatus Aenigmatarchaeota archaeon]
MKIKVCLVAHTENFNDNYKKFEWIVKKLENLESETREIKISWMLEEDDAKPFTTEIRGRNRGDVITNGKNFFNKLIEMRDDELGIHIHFTRNGKFDISKENQARLIKTAKEKFIQAFGFEPISFVGGHWYSDINTIKILEKFKFKVNASLVPLYKERRYKWLFGKIITPFKLVTCDWSMCEERKPYYPSYDNICKKGKSKVLLVPNAVDPFARFFSIDKFLSLDRLENNFQNCVEIFKNFVIKNLEVICIPFHPHSLTNVDVVKIFFEKCEEFSKKLSFIRLCDLV